jgi:hypothetical protein
MFGHGAINARWVRIPPGHFQLRHPVFDFSMSPQRGVIAACRIGDTAKHALERRSGFVSMRGSDLQCPRCWINNEVIASLRPVGDDTEIYDKEIVGL